MSKPRSRCARPQSAHDLKVHGTCSENPRDFIGIRIIWCDTGDSPRGHGGMCATAAVGRTVEPSQSEESIETTTGGPLPGTVPAVAGNGGNAVGRWTASRSRYGPEVHGTCSAGEGFVGSSAVAVCPQAAAMRLGLRLRLRCNSGWAEAPGCVSHRRCARWWGVGGALAGPFARRLPPCGWYCGCDCGCNSGWAEAPGCVLHRRCARWWGVGGAVCPQAAAMRLGLRLGLRV